MRTTSRLLLFAIAFAAPVNGADAPGAEDLVAQLRSDDDQVRFAAARALIRANEAVPAAVLALLELQGLRPGHVAPRASDAAGLFISFGPQAADAATPVLLEALRKDNYRIRRAATSALHSLSPLPAAHVAKISAL